MQARTLFLSKLYGWFCVLFALAMFANKGQIVAGVSATIQEPQLVLVLGLVVVAAGLGMVLSHNVWSGGAQPVIITLLGWATLVKGLIILFLKPPGLQAYYAALRYPRLFYVYAGVTFVVGAFLVIAGYRSTSAARV